MQRIAASTVALVLSLLGSSALPAAAQDARPSWDERLYGPLPRWREGGTPADGEQSLVPFRVSLAGPEMPPDSGVMRSPPEFTPTAGVLFRYSTSAWPQVVTDCVAALTGDPAHDEIAHVIVSSSSQQSSATSAFVAAGADMTKVKFIILPTDSIWIRDYGPHFAWQSDTQVVVDSHYYPTRPLDNFIPTQLADGTLVEPRYAMGLYYSGGNFQPGANSSGVVTTLVQTDNPDLDLRNIFQLYNFYQGIHDLHVMPRLPSSVDGTGHIDMWMYLVDQDSVIISQFKPGSNATAIAITNNAVPYMQALGYTVHRTPAWNVGSTHYTYANAFRVNDRIFVPIYGPGNSAYLADDQAALAAWSAAAGPGVTIVPINCYSIIPAAGAIHCIVMQVPRYTDSAPSAHVLSPRGGEVLVEGTTHEIRWAAIDDVSVNTVDLYYSTDGGVTYPNPIALGEPNDGRFTWTVPASAPSVSVRAVAYDTGGLSGEAFSQQPFEIRRARKTVYDFSQGAGIDKWAWGYQSSAWSVLNKVRYPSAVSTQLSAAAYAALAYPDATGGDTDPLRYISPIPTGGYESTHIVEVTISEDPASLLDLAIVWEGYGDDCLQVETYVWDNSAGNWSDGKVFAGANYYAANWAGNRDDRLEAHVRGNIQRYIDANGKLTLLLYAERSSQETFHDYVGVTVTF